MWGGGKYQTLGRRKVGIQLGQTERGKKEKCGGEAKCGVPAGGGVSKCVAWYKQMGGEHRHQGDKTIREKGGA